MMNTHRLLGSGMHGVGIVVSILLFCGAAGAEQTNAPGSLDTHFNTGSGADGFVRVVAVQPNGKVLLGGSFRGINGVTNNYVTRLNADGTCDAEFRSAFPTNSSRIYTIGVLSNGTILAAGQFAATSEFGRENIARFQENGALDPAFNAGRGPNGLVRILAVQPDGRILIGGEFTQVNATNRSRIARLHADGSLDTSFDPGTGANNHVRSVALLPNGQMLVGGLFTSFDNTARKYLVRLNADGSLDSAFLAGGGPDASVYFIAPQSDGTILVGGDFEAVNGTNILRIVRLHADGSLDPTFSPDGGAFGGAVYHVIRQSNGKILIGGDFTTVNGLPMPGIARLRSDGSLDPTFQPGTGVAPDAILTMALQADGNLVIGGVFTQYNGVSQHAFARVYGDPNLTVNRSGSGEISIRWPNWAVGYALEAKDDIRSTYWSAITNVPMAEAGQIKVSLPCGGDARYFRLTRP